MYKIIGVTELQRRFRAILDEVTNNNMPYVLTRGSRPEAAIIPYEEFLRLLSYQEQATVSRFDRLLKRVAEQNASYNEDEIAADIEAARNELDR